MKGRLYPWRTFQAPLAISPEVWLDGERVPVRVIDATHRRINLAQVAEPWATLTLRLSVVPPSDVPQHLDLVAHSLLDCVSTAQRIPAALEATDSGWRGDLTVHREEVAGNGILEAVTTATVQLPGEGTAGVARLVGRSEPWNITFDSRHGPPGRSRSPMRAVWEDFASPVPGAPTDLTRVQQALSYCDIVPAEPVLYLNLRIAGLQGLLDDPRATGRRRQVQQHLGAGIALDAVLALVDAAIHAVQPPEYGEETPGSSLPQALTATLHAIVEESDDFTDFAELVRSISEAKGGSDTDELNRIRAHVRSTAQSLVGSRRSAEALIKGVTDE